MRECTSFWRSLAFLSLRVVLGSVAIAVEQASSESIHKVDVRIDRIMNGLLPAAIINGQPLPSTAWTSVRLRVAESDTIDFFELGILDDDAGTESLVESDVNVMRNCG
jgi:hypothetical protein